MNFVDLIILIVLLFGFLLGFKRGFTKQLVLFVGTWVVLILSFLLKEPIATILYNKLPFFDFGGLSSLNILFYEGIAFFIIFLILSVVLKLLVHLTSIFEKILKMTIILGIPSKILGGILGFIQNLIYTFIVLYILSLPMFSIKQIDDSKCAKYILNNIPLINNKFKITAEIKNLESKYTDNKEDYNKEITNLLIENNVISKKNVEKLINSGKIDK